MTQLPPVDEQAIAQSELEQYINQQAFDAPILNQPASELPTRELIKHLLIGSPKAVTSTIQHLHQLGYAQVGDWSPLLPTVNPGEVMSILSKQILVH